MSLQVSSGIFVTDVTFEGDVNQNDKIGLIEAIYVMQKIAGIRP